MPASSGTPSTAITGMVRVAASRMRRITRPQAPPVRCCTINSPRLPMPTPVQATHAIRYAS